MCLKERSRNNKYVYKIMYKKNTWKSINFHSHIKVLNVCHLNVAASWCVKREQLQSDMTRAPPKKNPHRTYKLLSFSTLTLREQMRTRKIKCNDNAAGKYTSIRVYSIHAQNGGIIMKGSFKFIYPCKISLHILKIRVRIAHCDATLSQETYIYKQSMNARGFDVKVTPRQAHKTL